MSSMVAVKIVGPCRLNLARFSKYLKKYISDSNIEVVILDRDLPLVSGVWLSDRDAKAFITDDSDIIVVSVPLESNWFVRYVGNSSIIATTHDVDNLDVDLWDLEKKACFGILKFILVRKFLLRGGDYDKLYTRDFENSIFNFSFDKWQASTGMKCLKVGDRARLILRAANFTEQEIAEFERKLANFAPTITEKIGANIKNNVWVALFVSIIIGFIVGIIVNKIS